MVALQQLMDEPPIPPRMWAALTALQQTLDDLQHSVQDTQQRMANLEAQ